MSDDIQNNDIVDSVEEQELVENEEVLDEETLEEMAHGGKKKKKAEGGLMAAIKKVDREQSMKAKEGKVVRMTKRKSSNKNIARGCGAIMSNRRKKTKYS